MTLNTIDPPAHTAICRDYCALDNIQKITLTRFPSHDDDAQRAYLLRASCLDGDLRQELFQSLQQRLDGFLGASLSIENCDPETGRWGATCYLKFPRRWKYWTYNEIALLLSLSIQYFGWGER